MLKLTPLELRLIKLENDNKKLREENRILKNTLDEIADYLRTRTKEIN